MGTCKKVTGFIFLWKFQIHYGTMGTRIYSDFNTKALMVSNPLRYDGNYQVQYSGRRRCVFQIHYGTMGTEP